GRQLTGSAERAALCVWAFLCRYQSRWGTDRQFQRNPLNSLGGDEPLIRNRLGKKWGLLFRLPFPLFSYTATPRYFSIRPTAAHLTRSVASRSPFLAVFFHLNLSAFTSTMIVCFTAVLLTS